MVVDVGRTQERCSVMFTPRNLQQSTALHYCTTTAVSCVYLLRMRLVVEDQTVRLCTFLLYAVLSLFEIRPTAAVSSANLTMGRTYSIGFKDTGDQDEHGGCLLSQPDGSGNVGSSCKWLCSGPDQNVQTPGCWGY